MGRIILHYYSYALSILAAIFTDTDSHAETYLPTPKLLEHLHPLWLHAPAFINFLLCFHQERMLRSSGMNLEGLRWLVSRKSMASCHLASQSSDCVIATRYKE